MELAFYFAAVAAVVTTVLAITNTNPVHGLLYLIVSLLSVAMVFFTIGAPFAGILEVIVYAGAIMVLFVFVVMMLNLGRTGQDQERRWLSPKIWIGPSVIAGLLMLELVNVLLPNDGSHVMGITTVDGHDVGIALFGPYLLVVEFGSMLLLGALVAAFHLGRHD